MRSLRLRSNGQRTLSLLSYARALDDPGQRVTNNSPDRAGPRKRRATVPPGRYEP